jgi:hypothetical protein
MPGSLWNLKVTSFGIDQGVTNDQRFTNNQEQLGYLGCAGGKPERAGFDGVGYAYLDLQRLADIRYCISPESDAQRLMQGSLRHL